MEAFEIHFKMINKWGKKLTFVSRAIVAMTGWEATELTREFIHERMVGIESVEFDYWKVLNPFEAHFFERIL